MSTTVTHRVLLLGAGAASQGRLREIYLPALQDRPETVVSIWDGHGEASRSASAEPAIAGAISRHTAAIACAGPETPNQLVHIGSTPVLLDGAASLTVPELEQLAGPVRAAHRSRFHPAVTAVRGAIQSGRIGLTHAIHGELLVGRDSTVGGDLRGLVAEAIDVVTSLLGPLAGTAYAVRGPGPEGAGEAWTVSLRVDPGTIVTLLVGRSQPDVADTVHRYRVLGSHGQLLADLSGPQVEVIGPARRAVTFGPTPTDLLLDAFLDGAGTGTPDMSATLATARVLDALEASSTTNAVQTIGDDA